MEDEEVEWNVELEVSLFHAMRKHKPVGVPKHFHMTCIQEKLNSSVSRHISAEKIWKHLATMYDLQALDNSEKVPFPNKFVEFSLPKDGFDSILGREFPRAAAVSDSRARTPSESSGKERDRHGSGSSTRGSIKSIATTEKQPASKAAASLLADAAERLAEETPPKRDGRKRTRHSLQSPAIEGSTPTSAATTKRQRRI